MIETYFDNCVGPLNCFCRTKFFSWDREKALPIDESQRIIPVFFMSLSISFLNLSPTALGPIGPRVFKGIQLKA